MQREFFTRSFYLYILFKFLHPSLSRGCEVTFFIFFSLKNKFLYLKNKVLVWINVIDVARKMFKNNVVFQIEYIEENK